MSDKEKLVYCGLGLYCDPINNLHFEKQAGELKEIKDEKYEAEQRFVQRKLKKEVVKNG